MADNLVKTKLIISHTLELELKFWKGITLKEKKYIFRKVKMILASHTPGLSRGGGVNLPDPGSKFEG